MWLFLGALFILLLFELIRSKAFLHIRMEEIQLDSLPAELDGLRIVHLSDLHNRSYGRNNRRLAQYIRHHHPDLILCTGDMLQARQGGEQAFCNLLQELGQRYPVFYSMGNHELRLGWGKAPQAQMENCQKQGAVILDNRIVTLERRGRRFGLGGYCAEIQWDGSPERLRGAPLRLAQENGLSAALGDKENDLFMVLMAHDPDGFPSYAAWGADLTLSGHMHGGLWRPFGIGLLSPARRLFPRYTSGLYRLGSAALYVSTGLSGAALPRLFNRPELVVLTLRTRSEGEKNG